MTNTLFFVSVIIVLGSGMLIAALEIVAYFIEERIVSHDPIEIDRNLPRDIYLNRCSAQLKNILENPDKFNVSILQIDTLKLVRAIIDIILFIAAAAFASTILFLFLSRATEVWTEAGWL